MTIPSLVIGAARGSGAGRVIMARLIAESIGESATRTPIDNYYKDQSHLDTTEREQVSYDHPPASEWDLLYEQLSELTEGRAVKIPQYDSEIHSRKFECETVEPTGIIILEGVLVLYDENVNETLDLRLYVRTDADIRILRRIQHDAIDRGRDLQGVIDQYPSTVKPICEQLIGPMKRHADLITSEGASSAAVMLLEEKVQAEVEGNETRIQEYDTIEREVQERTLSHGSGN